MVADANVPLVTQLLLMKNYPLITYHRRGYAGSKEITRIKNSIAGTKDNTGNNSTLVRDTGIFRFKQTLSLRRRNREGPQL